MWHSKSKLLNCTNVVRHRLTCSTLKLYDDGVENTKKQLMTVCPGLQDAQPQLLESLLSVWKGVRDRLFKHYHFATKAYFMYLRMGNVVRNNSECNYCTHTLCSSGLIAQ